MGRRYRVNTQRCIASLFYSQKPADNEISRYKYNKNLSEYVSSFVSLASLDSDSGFCLLLCELTSIF